MPFHRFGSFEQKSLTRDLSLVRGLVIEGKRLDFGRFDEPAGCADLELVSDGERCIHVIVNAMHSRAGVQTPKGKSIP